MYTAAHNQDSEELDKFSEMANSWWDPNGDCRPLHEINPARVAYILERTPIQRKTVLDVGCGGGLLSESLAKAGGQVTGIDATSAVLKAARQHAEHSQLTIDYQECAAETFAEKYPEQFSVVTCLELLEHVPDPSSVVQACAKLTKPGGNLFFSTLNRTPKSYLFAILGAEYVLKLLPRQTHNYQQFIKPSELASMLRAAGLRLVDLKGLHYNPFTRSAWLNQDVSVNYILHASKS